MSKNKVELEGFVGKNIRTNDDKTYVSFSISIKKKDGKYIYVPCKGFKDISKNFSFEGKLVLASGFIDVEKYVNKDGVDIEKMVVIVTEIGLKYNDDVPY